MLLDAAARVIDGEYGGTATVLPFKRLPAGAHGRYPLAQDDGLDWYVEEPWVSRVLFERPAARGRDAARGGNAARAGLDFSAGIWDPACGAGNILASARALGIPARGSDIVDRGAPGAMPGFDFLRDTPSFTPRHIVTNPPYRQGRWIEFLRRALALTGGLVAMLLPHRNLEAGQRRGCGFWPDLQLKYWLVHTRRVCCPPGGRGIPHKGGSQAYAWAVCQRGWTGDAVVGWL